MSTSSASLADVGGHHSSRSLNAPTKVFLFVSFSQKI